MELGQTFKPQRDGSFSENQVHTLLRDLQDEPPWREAASREAAYYDGNQIDLPTLQKQAEVGIPPLSFNLIKPNVNSVRGFEAVIRTDPIVVAENDDSKEGAEAYNQKLKEITRITQFNSRSADAFAEQIKVGVGWLGCVRNNDPFGYPYQLDFVPWREMWWDWRARQPDCSDARYMLRRRWYDGDYLRTWFPQHEMLISAAIRGWPTDWIDAWERIGDIGQRYTRAYNVERSYTLEEEEWRDTERGRVTLYELLYRVPDRVLVMESKLDGRKMPFDRKNAIHAEALRRGMINLMEGPTFRQRQAYYLGPHRLADRQLSYRDYHYVPFFAYREDGSNVPYGLIRDQLSPQDEYNTRRSRLVYDTIANKVIIDEDAVNDPDETRREINRSDAFIIRKPERLHPNSIEIVPNTETSAVTFQLLQEAKQNVNDVSGISPAFFGEAMASQSGVALEHSLQQARQVLGPIMSNYEQSRMKCAELLLNMYVRDIEGRPNVPVSVERSMMKEGRIIMLNHHMSPGETTNATLMLKTRVALSETPETATYHEQKFQALVEVVKSFPPELQAGMVDLIVDASRLPNRDAILDRIRKLTGLGPAPTDPQELAAMQEEAQRKQAIQQRLLELDLMEKEADARMKEANAILAQAKAGKLAGVDTEHTEAKTQFELAKIGSAARQADRDDVDSEREIIETFANLISAQRQLDMARSAAASTAAAR